MKLGIAILLMFASSANAQGIGELAKTLDGIGSKCHDMASEFRSAESSEDLKRDLDQRLEDQRLRNEVQLYSVGHGRQQTSRYMLELMQLQAQSRADAAAELSKVRAKRVEDVAACIVDAVSKGKSAYAARPQKARTPSATDLMSAWVVNIESVTIAEPYGSDASWQAWQREKSKAELDAL
jgi:hypothetical protein